MNTFPQIGYRWIRPLSRECSGFSGVARERGGQGGGGVSPNGTFWGDPEWAPRL